MPELPEVETVRRQLVAELPGRTVSGVRVLLPRTVQNVTPEALARLVTGRTFGDVVRRGKYLLLPFTSDDRTGKGTERNDAAKLIVHLRMTGRLTVAPENAPEEPYTRVVFALDDGRELRFADMRTFGTIHFLGDGHDDGPPGLATLGPEPLEASFTPDVLAAALAGRRAPVKAVLLDQRRVAGLGNIYVDEALYASRIHPEKPAGKLGDDEIQRLHAAIRAVLDDAVAKGGTTIRDYVDGRGVPGEFQQYLRVYGRAGEPCRRCGGSIVRLRVAGRGTHVCPVCQR